MLLWNVRPTNFLTSANAKLLHQELPVDAGVSFLVSLVELQIVFATAFPNYFGLYL